MYEILQDLIQEECKEKQQIIVSSLLRNYRIIAMYDPFYGKFKDRRTFENYIKKKYNYFLGITSSKKYESFKTLKGFEKGKSRIMHPISSKQKIRECSINSETIKWKRKSNQKKLVQISVISLKQTKGTESQLNIKKNTWNPHRNVKNMMSFHEKNQDQIIEYRKKLKTATKFINTYQMMKDFQRKQKRLKLN